MISLELVIFLLASILTLALDYYHVPPVRLQQVIATILIGLIVLSGHSVLSRSKQNTSKLVKITLLFLSASLIQILTIATGGFLSPFLILIHLFTLGTSFLLQLSTSISFLVLSIIVLVVNVIFNPTALSLFRSDPWAVILYFISLIAIIPLSQFLMYSYHIKDTLSKVLKEYAQMGEKREESILRSINELAVITDKDLNILSTNEAAESLLQVSSSEITHHPLLEIFPLIDEDSKPITKQSLSIEQLLNDKANRIIKGLSFQPKGTQPRKVIVHIRPIIGSEGNVNQIVFIVIDESADKSLEKHSDLEQAEAKHKTLIEELKKTLLKAHLASADGLVERLTKSEEDLLVALELEDHPLKKTVSLQDIAYLGKQVVAEEQEFAKSLGVSLEFVLPPGETAESAALHLIETTPKNELMYTSDFTTPTDGKWLKIALRKVVEVALLLVSNKKGSTIKLTVNRENEGAFKVTVIASGIELTPKQKEELFTEYYGSLGTTSLHLGGGLEGFIAKAITTQLNIPMETITSTKPPSLSISFLLPKGPTQAT